MKRTIARVIVVLAAGFVIGCESEHDRTMETLRLQTAFLKGTIWQLKSMSGLDTNDILRASQIVAAEIMAEKHKD
jgi:hypothetical protein